MKQMPNFEEPIEVSPEDVEEFELSSEQEEELSNGMGGPYDPQ